MQLTSDHEELRRTLRRFIDEQLNPPVDEWERAETFPAHQVFKAMGKLDLLGLSKPAEVGGLGLDYSFSAVMAEELGRINCGGVPLSIGRRWADSTPWL